MIDKMLSFIAPHLCFGCHKIGTPLCVSCIDNIIFSHKSYCIRCGIVAKHKLCESCLTEWGFASFSAAGARVDVLKHCTDAFKFERRKALASPLAQLLTMSADSTLLTNATVVPIPTISRHIRQRGYDHTVLLARNFARAVGLPHSPILLRRGNTVQHTADKQTRQLQARQAFGVQGKIPKEVLLIDDIATTFSTLTAASKLLKEHGARHVHVAVVAYQPLDE